MDYKEAIDYLYNRTPMFQKIGSAAYKEGLENTYAIDKALNHPHKKYHTIHVAGTNGKGSTSHLIASILQHAGYKTGLYTSPHLIDFRERIKVNGQMISENFISRFITQNYEFFSSLTPTFFEVTTAMAFSYFSEEKVDVAVIETGLGGRLDCTNIINPDLGIITNISLDHTNLLGNTPELIAKEKAGIIKSGTPVIIGESSNETKEIFLNKANEVNATIFFAENEIDMISSQILPSGKWEFNTKEFTKLTGELGGLVQKKNAATVLCAIQILKTLGYNISPEAVYKGFASVVETTGLMGRWQIIGNTPRIILDTAHNIAGIEYVVQQLKMQNYNKLHIVFGMVNDKDIDSVLKLLPPNANYYFTKANIPRAMDENILTDKAKENGLKGYSYTDVPTAINIAKKNAETNDLIFIGGSSFIVADALTYFRDYRSF